MKPITLRHLQRQQVVQMATALEQENTRLREENARFQNAFNAKQQQYRAVFSALLAHLRRPRRWTFKGVQFDTLVVPLALAEDAIGGWELKFVIDRERGELRVTCVRTGIEVPGTAVDGGHEENERRGGV